MKTKLDIAKNWLPRYTGAQIDEFGDYILITNFQNYVEKFAEQFNVDIKGEDRPMKMATNESGLSIINYGMGSANVATIMDLLIAREPKGVLFLGKCGGLKESAEIGHFVLNEGNAGTTCRRKFRHCLRLKCTNLSRIK